LAALRILSGTRGGGNFIRRRVARPSATLPRSGIPDLGSLGARRECLLGIISEKIFGTKTTEKDTGIRSQETRDPPKYFISAAVIADFYPFTISFLKGASGLFAC
jgi:hypothetical protein